MTKSWLVQAVVKANSQTTGNGQILIHHGLETSLVKHHKVFIAMYNGPFSCCFWERPPLEFQQNFLCYKNRMATSVTRWWKSL